MAEAEFPEFVPASLAERITAALGAVDGAPSEPHTQLLAAEACLRRALAHGDDRRAAIDLLAADALLTSACGAAAGSRTTSIAALAAEAADLLAALVPQEDGR